MNGLSVGNECGQVLAVLDMREKPRQYRNSPEIQTMPRQFYSDAQRNSILTVVTAARKGRRKWAEVHKLAQDSGFLGGLPALKIFVSRAKKNGRKQHLVRAVGVTNTHAELEKAIDRLVQERVREALEKAMEVLTRSIQS
jgi:hypothetical protein